MTKLQQLHKTVGRKSVHRFLVCGRYKYALALTILQQWRHSVPICIQNNKKIFIFRIPTKMLRLDSRGQSFSDVLDESFTYSSGDELVEESGFTVDIDLPDGRLDSPQIVRTIVMVSPLDGTNDHFNVRLTSNHHSFSLGRSVTIRSINSFYFLQVNTKLILLLIKPSYFPTFTTFFNSFSKKPL